MHSLTSSSGVVARAMPENTKGSKAPGDGFTYLTKGLYTDRHETGRGVASDAIRGEAVTMVQVDGGQTSPTLLGRVHDWGDDPAWNAFFARYHPLLRLWCRGFALKGDEGDELCQRIWIELTARMRTFRYDPGRGFRRWLWRLFRSRAIDLLRARRAARTTSFDEIAERQLVEDGPNCGAAESIEDEERSALSFALLGAASAAQEAVCRRVDPETWRGYWLIAIEDRTVRETADVLGKKYTAVYNGYRRVERMLQLEGQRRLMAFTQRSTSSIEVQAACSGT